MIMAARSTNRGKNVIIEILKFILVYTFVELIIAFLDDRMSEVFLLDEIGSELGSLLINAVGIIIIVLFCFFVEKRNLISMGITGEKIVRRYVLGLLFGIFAFSSVILFGLVSGGYESVALADDVNPLILVLIFLGYLVQGLYEEILCRGFFMVSISRKNPVIVGIIISSIIFVFLHYYNDGFGALPALNLFLFGILTAFICLITGNIWVACSFHSAWNFVEGNVFGLSVSGISPSEQLFVTTATEKDFISGGQFGPEGGVAVTIVSALCIIAVLIYSNKK